MTSADPIDVLVVGAGPAGLALAAQAFDHGASVRVVERRSDRFRPSRALIVHPRTLEVLRPLGIVDSLLERGQVAPAVQLHLRSRTLELRLGPFELTDTAFPFLLFERQAEVEAVLSEALARRGVDVERGAEVVDLRHGRDEAAALVSRAGAHAWAASRFVVGCDGAGSAVRRIAGIAWDGAPYAQEVVLADLELDGDLAPGTSHAAAAPGGVLFLFAGGEGATWRMLGTRRSTGEAAGVTPGELQRMLDDAALPALVTHVAWSTRLPLEHRLASEFRSGPLFLVGDAAHVHSPAGGQGMNTGLQDATNLGWKLAFAARAGSADAASPLLDSYELERRPVARAVIGMTHLLFRGEAGLDPPARLLRSVLVPAAAPLVSLGLRQRRLVAAGVRVLSGLNVRYSGSPLSADGTPAGGPGPPPGDRLPDGPADGDGRRLHEAISAPGVHVLLAGGATEPDVTRSRAFVRTCRVPCWPGRGLVAVRPDGYVGLRSSTGCAAELDAWLTLAGAPASLPHPR